MIERFFKRFDLVPILGLSIGTISLTFQMKVLYPWHNELSEQMSRIETKIK